jgi:hypothetical protein
MRGWYQRKTPEQRRAWVARRNAELRYARIHKDRLEHPDKAHARDAVGNAVRRGKLIRQPCEVCGSPNADAHHEDYSKPLEVRWFCRAHHLELHVSALG